MKLTQRIFNWIMKVIKFVNNNKPQLSLFVFSILLNNLYNKFNK